MKKRNISTLIVASLFAAMSLATTVKADDIQPTDDNPVVISPANNDTAEKDAVKTKPKKTVHYYKSKPVVIKLKKKTSLYKDAKLSKTAGSAKKGSHLLISKLIKTSDGKVFKTNTGKYLSADISLSSKVKAYQNPKRYHQIHYTQVKPYGKVGYNLYRGYEGIKTWKVMHRMGTWAGRNYYNQATYNAVKAFQRRHHLRATGNVDEKTWVKMGFSKSSWKSIDAYVAPLKAYAWQGRTAHINAMIHQAYRYMGKPWLAGCSTSPNYGIDCSGLVMQALYAGGISPVPVSSIGHAHPGNEWNSRNLWADKKLKRVSYASRRRGDLVFYYQPGTRTIWHVGILISRNRVIDSWPPCVAIRPISNSQRNVIAGIKRPFV